jgi:hypothetical protein
VAPKPLDPSAYLRPATAGAFLFAAAAWLALFLVRHRGERLLQTETVVAGVPFDRYLLALRGRTLTQTEIAALADAVRAYLGAGREKTTREILSTFRGDASASPVRVLLTEGDLAKFSPWGSGAAGSDELVRVAEELIRVRGGDAQAR